MEAVSYQDFVSGGNWLIWEFFELMIVVFRSYIMFVFRLDLHVRPEPEFGGQCRFPRSWNEQVFNFGKN